MIIKVVSWNTGFRTQPWRQLLEMDADVALLQETCTRRTKRYARAKWNSARTGLGSAESTTQSILFVRPEW